MRDGSGQGQAARLSSRELTMMNRLRGKRYPAGRTGASGRGLTPQLRALAVGSMSEPRGPRDADQRAAAELSEHTGRGSSWPALEIPTRPKLQRQRGRLRQSCLS